LLVAGLLGCCNVVSADHASDTFLKMRIEGYFRNPLAFPEPGIDILAAPDPLAEELIQQTMPAAEQIQVMRGEAWIVQPGGGTGAGQPNGVGLWGLLLSTLASLLFGGCLSAANAYTPKQRRRRRVKIVMRKLASC